MPPPHALPPRPPVARLVVTVLCLLLALLGPAAQAAAPAITSVQFRVDDDLLRIALQADGTLPAPTAEILADPPRLIVDFPGVQVRYNEGNPRVFPIPLSAIQSLKILQHSTEPLIGRLVVLFPASVSGESIARRYAISGDGASVIIAARDLTGEERANLAAGRASDAAETAPLPPAQRPVITKLIHEKLGADHDRFRFEADATLPEPVVTLDGPRLLCRFNDAQFRLPPTATRDFQAPVDGAVVREFQIINEADGGVLLLLTLDPPRGHTLNHRLTRLEGTRLQLDVEFAALPSAPVEPPTPAPLPVPSAPAPAAGAGEQIAVLAGGQGNAGLTITQIQYQPTPEGERFIVMGNAPFEGQLERLTFPDRQSYTVRNARVALPAGVGDRYTIPLSSDLVQDMQVLVRETESGPEAQIFWRLNTSSDRDVQVQAERIDAATWHLDFRPAERTVPSTPAPAPAPVPELPVLDEPVIEEPVILEEPVVLDEPVVIEEPTPVVEPEPAITTIPEPEPEPQPAPAHVEPPAMAPLTLPSRPAAPQPEPEPVVEAPAVVEEPAIAEEPAVAEAPAPAIAIEEPVAPAIEETPAPAIEIEAPVVEAPAPVQPAPVPWGAAIRLERHQEADGDHFRFSSDVPFTADITTARFPNRLLIRFEGRPVDFDGLALGKTRFFKGAAASSVRLMPGAEVTEQVVQIALDRPLEEIDYEFVQTGTRADLRITALAPVVIPTPEPVVMPEPVVEAPAIEPEPAIEPQPEIAPAPVAPPMRPLATYAFSDVPLDTALAQVFAMFGGEYELAESVTDRRLTLAGTDHTLFEFLTALGQQAGIRHKRVNGVYRFYADERVPAPQAIEWPVVQEPAPEPEPVVIPEPEPVIEEPVVLEETLTAAEQAAEAERLAQQHQPPAAIEEPVIEEPVSAPEPEPVIAIEEEIVIAQPEPEPAIVEPAPADPPVTFTEPARPVVTPEPEPIRIAKADPPAPKPDPEIAPAPTPAPSVNAAGRVTGLAHRIDNGTDIIEVQYTGQVAEPVVNWLSYPAQLAISLLGAELAADDAGRQIPAAGSHVGAYKLWKGGSAAEPAVRVSLYLKEGQSPDSLRYHLDRSRPGTLLVMVSGAMAAPAAPAAPERQWTPRDRVAIEDGSSNGQAPAEGTETAGATLQQQTRKGRYFSHLDPTGGLMSTRVVEEPLVTLNVKDAAAADVIGIIAESYDLNISVDRGVKETITLRVTDLPLTVVFDTIAAQSGIKWFINDADIYIFAPENILRDRYGDSFQDVIVFEPKYASAQQMSAAIRQIRLVEGANDVTVFRSQIRAGGAGGQGGVSLATEKVVVKVTPNRYDLVMRVLRELDAAPVQIRLDVKILRVSQTAARRSGLDWFINNLGSDPGTVAFSLQEKSPLGAGFDPVTGAPVPTRGRPDFDLFSGFERNQSAPIQMNVVLNYLVQSGDAVQVANPNLTITSGSTGNLFVGETIPFRSTFQVSDFGRVTQRIANQQVGLNLQYSARADMERGTVSLSVTPNLSSLVGLTDIGPRTSNNNFTTNIVIPSGESFVVGGILNESESTGRNELPLLSDLPLLGKLFKSRNKQKDRSELILVFTPTILDMYGRPLIFGRDFPLPEDNR